MKSKCWAGVLLKSAIWIWDRSVFRLPCKIWISRENLLSSIILKKILLNNLLIDRTLSLVSLLLTYLDCNQISVIFMSNKYFCFESVVKFTRVFLCFNSIRSMLSFYIYNNIWLQIKHLSKSKHVDDVSNVGKISLTILDLEESWTCGMYLMPSKFPKLLNSSFNRLLLVYK